MPDTANLKTTLFAPQIPLDIPKKSQWLAGEGAGSWFSIKQSEEFYAITRYSPDGKKECAGIFQIKNNEAFKIEDEFEFVHLCHCKSVKIKQVNRILYFERTENQDI